MVLEHLFPEDWLEKKLRYAFILAVVYSTVGIIIARLLFGANSGIVAVVFTSLLLLPYLQKLFKKEELSELREKGTFKIYRFFIDNLPAIKVYFTLFFGIYFTFMLYTFLLPMLGMDVGMVFREQLAFEAGLRGGAFMNTVFWEIFVNNWWVLLACFLLALLAGDGAIFFITWNASTWGAIFGYRAFIAGDAAYGLWINLILLFLITLPHLILEGGAYILAAISGSVISDDVISESGETAWFLMLLIAGIAVSAILFWILSGLPILANVLINILVIFIMLRMIGSSFPDVAHKKVYKYNLYLFGFAIIIFLLGALIETAVLSNSNTLSTIYAAASGYI